MEKPIKHRASQEGYIWNSSTCACEYEKDCEIGEYLKNYECKKNPGYDLVVTCDDTVDLTESVYQSVLVME